MSVLPDWMVRLSKPVDPLHDRSVHNGMSFGVSHAGYDVRCKQDVTLSPAYGWRAWWALLRGRAKTFALLSTIEKFDMPFDVIGIVHDKSTWARRGIALQNTVIEPGWRGWLTLEVSNHGPHWVTIKAGDPIAQIIFHRMEAPPDGGYTGKYQDQPDEPVPALDDPWNPEGADETA